MLSTAESTTKEFIARAESLARRATVALSDMGAYGRVTHDDVSGLRITVSAFLGGGKYDADEFVHRLEAVARTMEGLNR